MNFNNNLAAADFSKCRIPQLDLAMLKMQDQMKKLGELGQKKPSGPSYVEAKSAEVAKPAPAKLING